MTKVSSLIPVRIAYAALGSGSAPVWVAQEAGIFVSEGLAAEVALIRGSGRVAKALLANEVQFANIAAPMVAAADRDGGDLVYLTGGINQLIQSIICRAGIDSVAKLRGGVFGASDAGGVDSFLMEFLLKPHGIDFHVELKKRSITNQPDAIAQLDRGDIDAALFSPPYSFVALQHGHRVLLDTRNHAIDYQLGGIVARRSYVEQNPEVARKMLRAYVRGIQRYKTDRPLACNVLKKYSLIDDDEVALRCYEVANAYFREKPYPTLAGLQRVLQETSRGESAAQQLRVEDLMDCRWLAQLDNSGFLGALYGGSATPSGEDVLRKLQLALEAASRTKRGRLVLEGHDEDFQIELEGSAPIHVEIRGGALAVRAGPSPRQEPLHFTRVQLDTATLDALLAGHMTPVGAMEAGKLFLRTRLYGGAQLTILLRAAYDLAHERLMARM
jgi:ABC-type nitrate/sulfonate/bicarbonate transport system substrate-binding protein